MPDPGTAAELDAFVAAAVDAGEAAGDLLRENFGGDLLVNEAHAHDIKLDLDVRSQDLITERLLEKFPAHAIFGEEGIAGNQESEFQWVVDPIDGTVNYYFGIPHFCVSIALRQSGALIAGVIHDPMMRETWIARKGGRPTLNGKEISVSDRADLAEAVVTVGFAKTKESMDAGFRRFHQIAYKVRKTRMMGSAALAMAYISCGRLDVYIEEQISLWDIAAGHLLIETAGGSVHLNPRPDGLEKYGIVSSNGKLPLDEFVHFDDSEAEKTSGGDPA